MTSETRNCQNCKQQFTVESEDFDFYKKISVPPPTWCPQCRIIRRMCFRNERALYRRKCDLCEKGILSMYPEDALFPVYCRDCWYSDKWDPLEYGRDYKWDQPFFGQFRELLRVVPRLAFMSIHTNVNCDYANFLADAKNAYLSYSIVKSENIFYSRFIDTSKECLDSFNAKGSEMIYENLDASRNYNTKYALRSRDSLNSAFLFDCVNCQDCFMSSNLRSKQFVFRNEQCTKEEYKKKLETVDLGSYTIFKDLKKEFAELFGNSLHKFANVTKIVNSMGDGIEDSKNARFCFDVYEVEDVKFGTRMLGSKTCYDIFGAGPGELLYEFMGGGFGSYNIRFGVVTDASRDLTYTDYCTSSGSLFGCVSLRKKEYCILNKQYAKQEYEELTRRIVSQMNSLPYVDEEGREWKFGEYFPTELSPFAYNETVAQEYFPLTKETAVEKGYRWKDREEKSYRVTKQSEDLPDHIKDISDKILDDVIGCNHGGQCNEQCTTAFKVAPFELEFYRRIGVPVPRLCPNCRYYARLKFRNPMRLWTRQCMCIGVGSENKVWKNT
ncbi:hypothetical protein C4587_02410, partial [Candidatus Parcubacteria bacterium]